MFRRFDDDLPPPRWEPPSDPRPALTRRQEKVLAWLIGGNLLMLLVGPLAGASLVQALLAVLRAR